ncbi:MAG: DUF2520 domain-containing protein [Gemmatimonadota bacterium]|nr:DUF2520 domain-containing protein [Gemmatimonadota bacterium]
MSERVFIIGPGHVGRGLSRAFRASGVRLIGLHGKRTSGIATSTGSLPPEISGANVIIVAVRDSQLDAAIGELIDAQSKRQLASGTVILHTSAIAEPSGLDRLRAKDFAAGTFHPLVPFADPDASADLLRNGWIGVDGDNAAVNASRRLAGQIGARTMDIPPGQKPAYHAAAVMASNFPVVLASVAARLLKDIGIPEGSSLQAVTSLMGGALANMKQAMPDDALTGPVLRGDAETVGKHLRALTPHGEAREVYRALSDAAVRIAQRRGTDPKKLAALTGILSSDKRREDVQE